MPRVYYNENNLYCAQWIANLISAHLLPKGDIDTRSIQDVKPRDLFPYQQCHFFAGLGGWPCALQLADFPADRPVWTGSCPCQPFSAAGKGGGFADERHLWPDWFHLISVCKPAIVLGEQIASRKGLEWFDLVQADLEGAQYAVGSADLGAAGVGAPHIRQRLWFVGITDRDGRQAGKQTAASTRHGNSVEPAGGYVVDADAPRPSQRGESQLLVQRTTTVGGGWWQSEPDVGRVAHGIPARVAKLCALGNAIVPQVAAEFIRVAIM